ncbi:MAG: hypothetical protein ACTSUO_06775 [Candidatus Thorarchaeota archaeon]
MIREKTSILSVFIPKGIIKHPERAIRASKAIAMRTLVHLIMRGNDIYSEPYVRAVKLWDEVRELSKSQREKSDNNHFIPICDVERPLRKNHLDMVFNTTAYYGNQEVKRVYAWREGTIGPLNSLLNTAGARLRFLGMTRYPFPRPVEVVVEHVDKDGRVYSKEHPTYGATKGKITVILTHPFLPELDFVDMLRGYLVELCRQCYIHTVPHSAGQKYIDLLLSRLRPFLDRLYITAITPRRNRLGSGGFSDKAGVILNEIINSIKGEHGTRISYPQRITKSIDTGIKPFTKTDFLGLIRGVRIHNKLDRFLTARDANEFANRVNNIAGRIGTRIHRRTVWGLCSPSSSRGIIHGGDYIAQDTSGFLHAAEVPVYSGRGKVDHSLFVRKQPVDIPDRTNMGLGNWFPSIVLDLKVRSAFHFNVRGKTQPGGTGIIPDFALKRRRLTDIEWEEMLNNTPSPREEKQVTLYGKGLLEEYKGSVREDLDPPPVNMRGIIVTDGTDSPATIRELLSPFIHTVNTRLREEFKKKKRTPKTSLQFPRMLFELNDPENIQPRLAVVTLPFEIPQNISPEVLFPIPVPLQETYTYDPFAHQIDDTTHFILYVSVATHGSPGDSAARIARDYHGLDFAHSSANTFDCKEVCWLDLAGEFVDTSHRPVILRLHAQDEEIQLFYRDIEFIDLSKDVDAALFEGAPIPSVESLEHILDGFDFVIVSGIEHVRSLTPHRLKGLDETLVTHLTAAISSSVKCLIWFDSPTIQASTSELFKHYCFRPVRFDSPLLTYIDEIVLNLPYPPLPGGSEVPICDYARGIARITPDDERMSVDTVPIPPLIGWSKRFRSIDQSSLEKNMARRLRRRPRTRNWLKVIGVSEYTEEMVSELFPFLKTQIPTKPDESLTISQRTLRDRDRTAGYRGVLSRITFDKKLAQKTKVTVHPVSKINTSPKHWTPKLKVKPTAELPLPPQESDLLFQQLDLQGAQSMELKQLQASRKILMDIIPEYSPLVTLLDEFVNVLVTSIGSKKQNGLVQSFSDFLAEHRHTQEIWRRTAWFRNYLEGWQLSSKMHGYVKDYQTQDHRFLLHYGNYFVLLLSHFWQTHNFTQMEIQELWETIRPWVVMQLGAERASASFPRPVFDMQTIYEQLRSRTRYYQERSRPKTVPLGNVRYGITVDLLFRNPGRYRWYIFEKGPFDKDVIMGCIKLEHNSKGYSIRANTIIPLDELRRLAKLAIQKGEIYPIMVLNHSGTDILYQGASDTPSSLDIDFTDEDWFPLGAVRFGTRYRGAPARLRFVKVVNPGISFPTFDQGQHLPRRTQTLAKELFNQLAIIQGKVSKTQRSRCTITGTDDMGRIAVISNNMEREKTPTPIIIKYSSRQEAERFLMYPYVTGLPFLNIYTWDPLSDISYGQQTDQLEQIVTATIQLQKKEES